MNPIKTMVDKILSKLQTMNINCLNCFFFFNLLLSSVKRKSSSSSCRPRSVCSSMIASNLLFSQLHTFKSLFKQNVFYLTLLRMRMRIYIYTTYMLTFYLNKSLLIT